MEITVEQFEKLNDEKSFSTYVPKRIGHTALFPIP